MFLDSIELSLLSNPDCSDLTFTVGETEFCNGGAKIQISPTGAG